MDNSYFTRRLFDTLTLAEEASDATERSVYPRACHYYKDLLCQSEARAAERLTVDLLAGLLFEDGDAENSLVVDLCCYGFRLQDRPELRSRGSFRVAFPGLAPVLALVVWRHQSWAGCQFTTPLHPALLEAAVALSRGSNSAFSWPPPLM